MSVKGYCCETSECATGKKGGGVGVLVRKELKYHRRSDLESCFPQLELCILELFGFKKNTIMCSLYRTPNSEVSLFLKSYKELIAKLGQETGKNLILGLDHNMDLLKSSLHKYTQEFLDSNTTNNLWQIITKPTRITKSSATLIDNIIISEGIYGHYECGILLEDISDHLPCMLIAHDLKLHKKEPIVITSRKITPKTLTKIKSNLSLAKLDKIVLHGDLNDSFDKFHEKVVNIVDNVAPYESFRPGKYSFRKEAWLPCSLLKCIKKQKVLYKMTLKADASDKDFRKYKQYRNMLTKIKRHCKCTYYQNKCYEFRSNTKALWKVINTITGNLIDKSCVVSKLCENGIGYNKPEKIANIF